MCDNGVFPATSNLTLTILSWICWIIFLLSRYADKECGSNYHVIPLTVGAEVFGIDLSKDLQQDVINKIKQDVTKHEILLFRKQGNSLFQTGFLIMQRKTSNEYFN